MRACSGPNQLLATARSLDQWRAPKPAAAATRCWRVTPCSLTRLRLSDAARATLAQQNPWILARAHQNTFDTSEQRPRRRTGRISPTFGPLEPPADASHRLPRRVEPSNAGVGIRARAARGAADKAAASTTSSMRTRPNKRCAGTRTYSSARIPKVNSTSMGLPQFATAALLGGCVVNEATCVACCCSRVSLLKALLEYHAQGLVPC